MTENNTTARPRRTSNRQHNIGGQNQQPPPAQPQQTQIERPKAGLEAIQSLLSNKKAAIARVIPQGAEMTAEGIIQNALQIIADDRHLRLCTPKSVLYAILAAAKLGLDFVADRAYLIPYSIKDERGNHSHWAAGFLPGYRGFVDVAGKYGFFMDAQPVHANDEIDFSIGSVINVKHRPAFINRGDLIGSYCIVRDLHGRPLHTASVVQEEIAMLQQDTPAWKRWRPQMVKKCAVKRAFNLIPKSNGPMALLAELDNRAERQKPIEDLVESPKEPFLVGEELGG